MKTSLITDVLGPTSHADELSESSNIMFSNSEIKLLNSSLLLSSAGAEMLSSILKPFTKSFY